MPKPHLLFLVTEASYFFSHRYPIAKAAQGVGYQVSVATQDNPDVIQRFKKEGFTLYPLKSLKRASLNPWNQIRTLWELYHLYRRVHPHIVHHVAMKPVLYGTIVAKLARVPQVVNAITGLGFIFISSTLLARLLRIIFTMTLKIFSGSNVYYILQNRDDQSLFKRFISPKQLILIPGSGVNTNRFTPSRRKLSLSGPFTVGIPARLLWDKGIGDVIEAQKILRDRNIFITLVLAGGLDTQNPSRIPSHIIAGWEKNSLAHWAGKIEDMRSFLSTLNVALLPSYREGLPLALLEAASMGLPIITTDVPGCRDVVIDRTTGLLIPSRDPMAIANALEFCVRNRDLLLQWGQKGRAYILENFSEPLIVQKTLTLYQKILSR